MIAPDEPAPTTMVSTTARLLARARAARYARSVRLLLLVALALTPTRTSAAGGAPTAGGGEEQVIAQVTVYGAAWCGACKSLEASLKSRGIPFEAIDVDANPGAYAIAKKATGTNAIPISNIVRGPLQTWIVGANPDAVEKAYRGE